ncbi:MAG: glutamine amidotransferase [Armatimonadota bacterium]|nr:glutamine amidotransferase [Armatimonadota bacterium]MDR7464021.1 glutamine amidotransferase [Armatimonadota bacterium]MDR7468905.1 glutamine amidotransferase [Armatimonadota bacterium]MDR7474854.1 glutamine amidotransferase [Armatimonadota bacterium]MDR7539695.1 glutamine amidotransferase [Armatimonadota bacterium]
MIRVLYAGGAGAVFGPLFALSPFALEVKGLQFHNWARPFIEGLERGGDIQVTQMPSWEVYASFPRELAELKAYHVVVIEEVEADIFYFYPEFYTPEAWTSPRVIVLPNRLELIRQFVQEGGGLLMVGGWLSFQGRFGHGVWHGTPVEEALPVVFQPTDDRVETPQGALVTVVDRSHPVMGSIAWEGFPPLLGYNRAAARPDARVLATVRAGPQAPEDPLIVVREYGRGRTMVFASDTTPHWGVNFMKWPGYQQFWRQAVLWLSGQMTAPQAVPPGREARAGRRVPQRRTSRTRHRESKER